jgi:hypothetical protein
VTGNDAPTRESVTRELRKKVDETEEAWRTIKRNTRREAELHVMLHLIAEEEKRHG